MTQIDTVRDIETVTGEILEAKRVGGEAVLTIGRGLIEAKTLLEHGEWLPWLTERVEFSERTAQNFMRLSREWSNPQTLADLGASKALQLLALPEAEREEFIEEHNVIDMSARELAKAIKERDEARKAAEQAQADSRAAQEARASMEQSLKSANELASRSQEDKDRIAAQAAELKRQLAELRSKPVDVAVMAVDQEAIDRAKAEAVAGLQAQLDEARRAAALAGPEVAQLEVYYTQVQETVNKMRGLLLKARRREDQTTAEQMAGAILSLAEQVRGCAE